MKQMTDAQTWILVARLDGTRSWSLPASRVSLGQLFAILDSRVLLCPVTDCCDLLVLTEPSSVRREIQDVDTCASVLGRGSFFLSRGTFKMKYLEIEGTTVHQSIKNIEVKKKWSGVSCTHLEQQCCTQPNSWLLEPSQETDFVKARTSLYLTHCIWHIYSTVARYVCAILYSPL